MVKQGLLDGDILCYEIAWAAEAYWRHHLAEKGVEDDSPPPWHIVEDMLFSRIEYILDQAGADQNPIICFTGKTNFRNHIARTQPYKDRDSRRPFHYANIRLAIPCYFQTFVKEGLEADDVMSISLGAYPDKYICITRDKDLRQVAGWHYGWEVHNQASFGPKLIDEFGWIELSANRKKIIGGGQAFLHAQILMGDDVDTIPGIPDYGPVKVFKTLQNCKTVGDLEEACINAYKAFYGLDWLDRMRETGRLVYMTREIEGNKIKLYNPSFLNREEWIDLETGEIEER